MKHFRRKRLLSALNRMYLDNAQRTKSYSDFLMLEKSMQMVSDKQRKIIEAEQSAPLPQLTLFP